MMWEMGGACQRSELTGFSKTAHVRDLRHHVSTLAVTFIVALPSFSLAFSAVDRFGLPKMCSPRERGPAPLMSRRHWLHVLHGVPHHRKTTTPEEMRPRSALRTSGQHASIPFKSSTRIIPKPLRSKKSLIPPMPAKSSTPMQAEPCRRDTAKALTFSSKKAFRLGLTLARTAALGPSLPSLARECAAVTAASEPRAAPADWAGCRRSL